MANHKLKYVGKGMYIEGVPAEDHTVSTKAEADRLVESGLYKLEGADDDQPAAKSEPAKSDDKPEEK